jgi:hypothetical protein
MAKFREAWASAKRDLDAEVLMDTGQIVDILLELFPELSRD